MRSQILVRAALVACLVGAVIMLAGPTGIAQQGPPAGKGGGGGGHTESAVNQLSYPAVLIGAAGAAAEPLEATSHVLGKTYSWGCSKPEEEYPNTSCVTVVGGVQTWLTREQCVAFCGEEYAVDRMYWQKITTNYWKAETTGPETSVTADFLDWGDNLESRSWTTTSSIRVETTPFEWHKDDTTGAEVLKRGYQMWHVYGQGPSEVWGVRAQAEDDTSPPTAVYYYDSPYAIIHTGSAKLHMAKLGAPAASCPTTYTPSGFSGTWTYDTSKQQYTWGTGSCTLRDTGYTAELNVGGKYVYGYNWQIRSDRLNCGMDWVMPGWWRLTFYTPGTVVFDDGQIPTGPPTLPTAFPLPLSLAAEAEEGDSLYKPVIDVVNNLTYIDICIKGGGGKK